MADDEELAALLGDPPAHRERLRDWSPERELLVQIYDRLGSVIQAQVAAAGAKPPKIAPFPRPVTAMERARTRRSRERYEALVRRVAPHLRKEGPPDA